MTANKQRVDTLYYDGDCSLCSKEMRSLTARRGEKIRLVNVHEAEILGDMPDKQRLLRDLHLQTQEGTWLTGVDANVRAWRGTKRGALLSILSLPIIKYFSGKAYRLWADKRYTKRYCKSGQCRQPTP